MLVRPHDAPLSEAEWRALLEEHDFGTLVAQGRGRDYPVILPTHFAMEGDVALLHVVRSNPVLEALREEPRAVLSVIAAYTYVEAEWNEPPETPREYAVPTSYYAAVQLAGRAELVETPEGMAALLTRQLARFEPHGQLAPVEPGDNPYGRQLRAIVGVKLHVERVTAKFKFGGNKTPAHRLDIARHLEERGAPLDLEARAHLLRRLRR